MFNLNQWVTWEPIQYPGEPKPRKIPCGGSDAHDPANWMPFDAAQAITSNIGFVLTETDPYFCIDIDHALQADGSWSQLALTVIGMFPGAYVEVSYSGDGLHIFAQGVMPEGFKHKNSALGLEIYDRLRYIAVTRTSAIGTPDINHQAALNAFVTGYMEQAVALNALEWTNGPRADWNGPIDDDELIKKFLNARPSANALWGGTATVRNLWEGNAQAFVDSYPDTSALGYDQSSPDMALAAHLAFWTGCDCERIERLMWRSALVRPKWTEHPTYLRNFTITKAVAGCQNVYTDPRGAPTVPTNKINNLGGESSKHITPTAPGAMRQGLQYLTPDAQLEYFKNCTYIINTHRVLRPNGSLVSPEQFKVIYGGYDFAMDNENHKSSKCAWEAFTKSRAVNFPVVEGLLFRPEMLPGVTIEHEGMLYINSYQPVQIRMLEGDPAPFLDLMYKLFPNEYDRAIIFSYMAAVIQCKGVKFQWCPIIQGAEGNGKSFLTRALIYSVGDRLSHLANPKDISNKFNFWIEGKVFAGVEEVYVSDRRDAIDALKIIVTNDRLEIQPKGGNQYMGDNRANLIMNSNHLDAIRKTKNDRRYAPFFTPQQSYSDIIRDGMGGDYFPNLYEWARADGYAIIANYLTNYQIPDALNPATKCHRAPETSSTKTAIQVSQGPVEQEIENAIGENLQGFRGGWISAMELDHLLQRTGKARMIPRNRRTEMLEEMGYIKMGRATMEIQKEGGRPMLYMKQGIPNTGDLAFDYMKAQGYITP